MNDPYKDAAPSGYHNVTPSITVRGASAAIEFYQRAFDAKVHRCMKMPDGKVIHAEIILGDSAVMLNDEMPDWGVLGPLSIGGSATVLQLYVADADAVFEQAVAEGGGHPSAVESILG
jgi:PhnB protein